MVYTVRITGLPVTALQQLSIGLSNSVTAALTAALPLAGTITSTSLQLFVPSASSSV